MTVCPPNRSENALAVHFDPEPFAVFADGELSACALHVPGVCFNPLCSRVFAPAREWQQYCSAACRQIGDREMRRVGHKAAPALLAWQMGRYAKGGPQADLSRAGRRYYSALAADWLRDRRAKQGGAA
ncbi:MAG: hypothetical protein ABJM82_18190 [Shimia thalassica]|uniref:hypothetical protein n=1 Tax=Shimia thalassica TaxID=1715693 RepID=UPI003298689A